MKWNKFYLLKVFTVLACCFYSAFASAAEVDIAKGQYIVVLKDSLFSNGTSVTESGEAVSEIVDRLMADVKQHQMLVDSQEGVFRTQDQADSLNKQGFLYERVLKGFSATLTEEAAEYLKSHPEVDYIEQDHVISVNAVQSPTPSWGIDRIDQRNLPLNKSYLYYATGRNVHAYVVDTGILATHREFSGRVGIGYDFIDNDNVANDCHGHGTHVAGTLGGTTVGVAKNVTIHPLKVFNCQGKGSWAPVLAALEAIFVHHQSPAVVNMSLGGGAYQPVDTAVQKLIDEGITVVVSAGNSSANTCLASPARVTDAITVASSNSSDSRSWFSNYGPCVDTIAPGSRIYSSLPPRAHLSSSCNDDDGDSYGYCNGTSMASPHVAGVVALYLERYPRTSPSKVASALITHSSKDKITNAGTGTANRLLFNQLTTKVIPNIVGLAYVDSHKMACAWYDNGYVSCGLTFNLDSVRTPYRYSLPTGYSPDDIVDITWIGSPHNMACAWYKDGKVSCGSTSDLDSVRSLYSYSLPRGYRPSDIKGIAWLPNEKMACAWYDDNRGSCGSTGDLDSKLGLTGYTMPAQYYPRNILGMAWVEHRNMSCTWYNNGYVSCGNGINLGNVRSPYRYKTLD